MNLQITILSKISQIRKVFSQTYSVVETEHKSENVTIKDEKGEVCVISWLYKDVKWTLVH